MLQGFLLKVGPISHLVSQAWLEGKLLNQTCRKRLPLAAATCTLCPSRTEVVEQAEVSTVDVKPHLLIGFLEFPIKNDDCQMALGASLFVASPCVSVDCWSLRESWPRISILAATSCRRWKNKRDWKSWRAASGARRGDFDYIYILFLEVIHDLSFLEIVNLHHQMCTFVRICQDFAMLCNAH